MESERESSRLAHSLDTGESLPDYSYPLRRIVSGTTEISPAESLFLASKKR